MKTLNMVKVYQLLCAYVIVASSVLFWDVWGLLHRSFCYGALKAEGLSEVFVLINMGGSEQGQKEEWSFFFYFDI